MASSIGRGDPEYATAMREAKALFEAAMAKGAMKGGRPRANAAAATVAAAPTVAAAAAAAEEDDLDMSDVLAEAGVEVAEVAAPPAPAPAAAGAAVAAAAPAKKKAVRRRAKGESA